jgi:uncharacterized membrane-anchored protein
VPEVFLLFWIVKLITTGIGEAGADFMGSVSIPLAGMVGVGGFFVALRFQLRADTYHPARGEPHSQGGLGWGDGAVTALGLALFAALVGYLPVTHSDVEGAHAHDVAHRPAEPVTEGPIVTA